MKHAKLQCVTTGVASKAFCYHHMGNNQLLHHYRPFNVSRYCRVLYGISSHEPASHLLSPLLIPFLLNPTPHCSSTIFVKVTIRVQLLTCQLHVGNLIAIILIILKVTSPQTSPCKVNRAQAH